MKLVSFLQSFSEHGKSFFAIYLCLCFLISLPIVLYVWDILYLNPVPAGGDPADHTLYTMKIMDTGNPLIEYTQFPSTSNGHNKVQAYYPSFLHVLTSIPAYILHLAGLTAFDSVVSSMTALMFISYMVGIIGYALVVYTFLTNVVSAHQTSFKFVGSIILLSIALLACGIFLYSTSPILKTFRDGGYGEVLAMWTILPFYILLLFRRRWILAGILFGVIASINNISIVLTLAVSIAFVLSLLIRRDFRQFRNLWRLGVAASICSIPAILFFYYPVIIAAANQETGLSSAATLWTRADIAQQIGSELYYYGIVASIGLLFINYRKSSWLICWIILYLLPFHFNIFFLERLAREFSIPFGLVSATFTAAILFIVVTKFYPGIASKMGQSVNRVQIQQAIICITVTIIIVPLYYNISAPRFEIFGQSSILAYYSDALSESNTFLLNSNHNKNETVVLFGVNPWLKPYTFGNLSVFEVETPDVEKSLSKTDGGINKELRSIIENPNSDEAEEAILKYKVKYLYLSDTLAGRWYPESQRELISVFTHFEETYDKEKMSLERQWRGGDGEILQVYSVHL